jgi:hypothetical protein
MHRVWSLEVGSSYPNTQTLPNSIKIIVVCQKLLRDSGESRHG